MKIAELKLMKKSYYFNMKIRSCEVYVTIEDKRKICDDMKYIQTRYDIEVRENLPAQIEDVRANMNHLKPMTLMNSKRHCTKNLNSV